MKTRVLLGNKVFRIHRTLHEGTSMYVQCSQNSGTPQDDWLLLATSVLTSLIRTWSFLLPLPTERNHAHPLQSEMSPHQSPPSLDSRLLTHTLR